MRHGARRRAPIYHLPPGTRLACWVLAALLTWSVFLLVLES